MAVRPFAPDDADGCAAVIQAAVVEMGGLNAAARRRIASRNTPGRLGAELMDGHTLVVEGSTGLAGLGMLREAELCRVYVHPDDQRRGLGRLLVVALEDEAMRRGLGEVWIQASPSSVRFWLGLGFTAGVTETTRVARAEFVHVRMSKVLTW